MKLRSSVKDMGGIMDSTVKNLERNKNIQVRIPNNKVQYQKTPKMEKTATCTIEIIDLQQRRASSMGLKQIKRSAICAVQYKKLPAIQLH